jgi:hypothetical protein
MRGWSSPGLSSMSRCSLWRVAAATSAGIPRSTLEDVNHKRADRDPSVRGTALPAG